MATVEERLASELPAYARQVVDVLEAAGHEAWVVGGWVRDALLGRAGHDVDVCSSAPWAEAARVLRQAGMAVHETGTAHGTVTAVVGGHPVEVTTFREEGRYSDLRHPDEVRFVDDVRADLARRDLTVNAIAYHPARGLVDPFGGLDDLGRGVVRAVGDPHARFGEDALRVLRAVRFACRLGFAIEPATHDALADCAGGLAHIAPERIGQEMRALLATGRASWALRHEFCVLAAAVPELAPMEGFDQRSPYHAYDVLEHTARVCAGVEAVAGGVPSEELRWAALLHDVAKPACWSVDDGGRGHFFDHPAEGARVAGRVMRRLAVPGEVVRGTCAVIALHDLPVGPDAHSVRHMLAELDRGAPGRAPELGFALLDLMRADALGKAPRYRDRAATLDQVASALRAELARGACYRVRDLAVGGADVVRERGFEPGPGVGMVLEQLLVAVMDEGLPNEREALLEQLRW